jgi:hypothetical protein
MKKQTKTVLSIVIAFFVVIIALILIFPSTFSGLTSGTFGKADKYRKSQMSEKDIQLRSEYTQDTVKLKEMVKGLIYFSAFTTDLTHKIDSSVLMFKEKGFNEQQKGYANLQILKDYSEFIKNSNKTLDSTILMLHGFLDPKNADQSADVEKTLRDFGTYVTNMNEKDSILELALVSMDNFMTLDKNIKTRKKEMQELKSVRDQLLLHGIQLGALILDKPLSSNLLSYALSSQSGPMSRVLAQENVSAIANMESIKGILCDKDQFGSYFIGSNINLGSAADLKEIVQSKNNDLGSKLIGSCILYDKDNLRFVVSSAADLSLIVVGSRVSSSVQSMENVGIVVFLSRDGINMMAPAYELGFYNSLPIGSAIQSTQLGRLLLSADNVGSISYGSGFIGFVQNLGFGHQL